MPEPTPPTQDLFGPPPHTAAADIPRLCIHSRAALHTPLSTLTPTAPTCQSCHPPGPSPSQRSHSPAPSSRALPSPPLAEQAATSRADLCPDLAGGERVDPSNPPTGHQEPSSASRLSSRRRPHGPCRIRSDWPKQMPSRVDAVPTPVRLRRVGTPVQTQVRASHARVSVRTSVSARRRAGGR